MRIRLESTSKIVSLRIDGVDVPARMWQGTTESGIPVHAFVTRITPDIPITDPDIDALTAEFDADLQRTAAPTVVVAAMPSRLIL